MIQCIGVEISKKKNLPVLFVLTGSKKEVFIGSQFLKPYCNNEDKIILTDIEHIDIFCSLPNTKIYAMNPESFLILAEKSFKNAILRPDTELSIAFCNNFIKKQDDHITAILVSKPTEPWKYYFNQTPHPIDIVHQKLKRKGKYLIGINVGETEHVTKKLSYSFLCELMDYVSSKTSCRFVLFGTTESQIRSEMLRRECNSDTISMIGDFNIDMFSQAISMCDCFISLNSFLLHLSIAVKQDTIGMFYRDELKEKEIMLPNLYPFVVKKKCDECEDDDECRFIYKCDERCLESFNAKDIGFMAMNILNSKGG